MLNLEIIEFGSVCEEYIVIGTFERQYVTLRINNIYHNIVSIEEYPIQQFKNDIKKKVLTKIQSDNYLITLTFFYQVNKVFYPSFAIHLLENHILKLKLCYFQEKK